MNCKPGELVILVSEGINPKQYPHVGWIGKTLAIYSDTRWRFDPPCINPKTGKEVVIRDSLLRPIRDAGEDAKDEALSWLPAPTLGTA